MDTNIYYLIAAVIVLIFIFALFKWTKLGSIFFKMPGIEVKANTNTDSKTDFKHNFEKYGLLDIGIGRTDGFLKNTKIEDIIIGMPTCGEILLVGRTLKAWGEVFQDLAHLISQKGLKVTMVIADPTIEHLISPVHDDCAVIDLKPAYDRFNGEFLNLLKSNNHHPNSEFLLYGIPSFPIVSYSEFVGDNYLSHCILEVGIATPFTKRVNIAFKKDSDNKTFENLSTIFRKLIENKKPLIKWPE